MVMVLQGLHVLFGILWFGGAVYGTFVVVPAANKIDPVHANAFTASYGKFAEKYMMPVSILTLVFGIILGFPLNAWASIGTTYGTTYLIAFLVALVVFFWGLLMIAPLAKRLNGVGQGSPEFVVIVDKLKKYGSMEMLGFLILFIFMVALRFNY